MQIGLNCRIIRNGDGTINTVEAPNGEPSILYKEALRVTGSQEKASDIWATAYTKGYADYIGMKVQDVASNANVDKNGEPLFQGVADYLSVKESVSGNYTRGEMSDVNDFIISTGFSSMDNLYDRLSMLYDDGSIVFTKERLTSSGIWSEAEADRILGNPVFSLQAKESIRRFLDYYSSAEESQGYYMADAVSEVPVYTDEYTSFGTRKRLNPAIISNSMKESLSGITDREEFDRAVSALPYQEIVERYNEDADYAESVYNRYSKLSKIPVIDNSMNAVNQIAFGFRTFFRPAKKSDFEKADKTMDDLLMMDSGQWERDTERVVAALRYLELYAADMGLDIVGLSDMYYSKSRSQIIPFISDLMVLSRRMQTMEFSESDIDAILLSRDNLFGLPDQDYKIEALNEDLRGLDLGYMGYHDMSPRYAFDELGLLSIGGYPGIYQRVDNSVTKEDIYDFLYEVETDSDLRAKIIPDSAMKSVMGEGGISLSRLRDPKNKDAVIRDIASYVRERMLPGDTEQMAAYRVAFRHPVVEGSRISDMNRSLDRYLESGRKENTYLLESEIYRGLLRLKANDREKYDEVFGGIRFYPGEGISLMHSDASTLRMMDLQMEDELRDNFREYALNSENPSLFDMFYLKRHDMGEADEGFYRRYYTDNPEALQRSKGSANKVSDKITGIVGEFSNFVRIGDSVYEKVGEYNEGSFYMETGRDKTGLDQELGRLSENYKDLGESDSITLVDGVSKNSEISKRLEC